MCGIAGTVFNKNFLSGKEIRVSDLEKTFLLIQKDEKNVYTLLDQCWQYKSNINFLRYYRNKSEKENIKKLCAMMKDLSGEWLKKLPLIDKRRLSSYFKERYKEYETLLDCQWFLDHEIKNLFGNVTYFTGLDPNHVHDSTIIFYKNLNYVINAIDNRLEIRGRDSLGISIQFILKDFQIDDPQNLRVTKNPDPSFSESIHFEKYEGEKIITFLFKTANPIGSLGDNAKVIKNLIKNNSLLNKIVNDGGYEQGSIVIHTRWASVGEVNVNNCHPITNLQYAGRSNDPLILASMNGDIYNYKEIINGNNLDDSRTTDCLAIPFSLTLLKSLNINSVKDAINSFVGSFTLAIQASNLPGTIILASQGKQGLYIGISYDGIMFASDVYGLIEACRFFYPVKSGSLFLLSPQQAVYDQNFNLKMTKLDHTEEINVHLSDLKTTNITTRDIHKGKFSHFLEKEIRETKDIIQRTILGYLQQEEGTASTDYLNAIVVDNTQVFDRIVEKFKNNQIKQVIITGMGTCYTAAAAIAMYMRSMLRYYCNDIQVEPHIASEGSAFYLKPNMNDTLVIVVAQSGTTIDTNVYVQMAKERGAMSLALANKREGDVTFIVDGTLYIGSGRDIEIAVPSTKTYTAQVILGYILTLYFCCRLANKNMADQDRLGKHIESLRKIPELIEDTFLNLNQEKNLEAMRNNIYQYNSWYILHDDSPNSVCAMEIRIKFSECCYHTLPYLHIDQAIKNKVKDSFLTYMTNEKLYEIEERLITLLQSGNSLIVIGHFDRISVNLESFITRKKLWVINIPPTDPFFSFIPTIITGQLLSYYGALLLDERKKYFQELINATQNNNEIEQEWDRFLSFVSKRTFDQGFSIMQFNHLENRYKQYKETNFTDKTSQNQLIKCLYDLYQFTRRPIDTIKHQAKTITVGAVRETAMEDFLPLNENQDEKVEKTIRENNEIKLLSEKIREFSDPALPKKTKSFKNFFVYSDGLDESYRNFIINFMNEIGNRYNLGTTFRPAKYYELSLGAASNDEFWIFITNGIDNKSSSLLNGLGEKRHVVF
ncbi:MAG: SIS domain-containing protein, partial [Chlamydiota bacterium]|nr:SIS domain-containing protein [Chlamydiota bacterium]